MRVTLLRAADRVATPWKNGGGLTETIASWPEGAVLDDSEWRVSVARIDRAGPFSRFPGVNRALRVLEGRVALGGVELDAMSPPFAFSGDDEIVGVPLDGPVRVLNVMTRRGVWRADVAASDAADFVMLVAVRDTVAAIGSQSFDLCVYDALLVECLSDAVKGLTSDLLRIALWRV